MRLLRTLDFGEICKFIGLIIIVSSIIGYITLSIRSFVNDTFRIVQYESGDYRIQWETLKFVWRDIDPKTFGSVHWQNSFESINDACERLQEIEIGKEIRRRENTIKKVIPSGFCRLDCQSSYFDGEYFYCCDIPIPNSDIKACRRIK